MHDKDRIITEKILDYCEQIKAAHSEFGDDKSLFDSDGRGAVYKNSVSMPIQQIGELAKRYSDDLIKDIPGVPWKQIKGMRDLFAHDYDEMDTDTIWETSHSNIEALQKELQSYLEENNDMNSER